MSWTAIDTETKLAGNRNPIPQLVSVAIADHTGASLYAAHERDVVVSRLRAALAGGAIFANAPFDLFVLWLAYPEIAPSILDALEGGRVIDVLTREKLVDIALGQFRKVGPYNLGAVAGRRANVLVDKSDPWRRRYGSLLGWEIAAWSEGARRYALLDGVSTHATAIAQEMERARWDAACGIDIFGNAPDQARAHMALYAMTLEGLHTHAGRVAELDMLLSARIRHLEQRALDAGIAKRKHTKRCPTPDRRGQCVHVQRTKAAAQDALVQWCRQTGREVMRNDVTDKAAARGECAGSVALSKKALEAAGIPRGRWGKRCGEDPHVLYDRDQSPIDEDLPALPHAIAHPIEVYRELGGLRASYSKNIPVLKHPIIRTRYGELVATGRASASGFKMAKVEDGDDDEDADEYADFDCELDPGDEWVGTNTQNWPREGGWRECIVPPPADEWSEAAP